MNLRQRLDERARARGGLILDSDYLEEEKLARIARTERVIRMIKGYAKLKICGSERAAVANILADLRHYCQVQSLPFSEINKESLLLYEDERDLERELSCC